MKWKNKVTLYSTVVFLTIIYNFWGLKCFKGKQKINPFLKELIKNSVVSTYIKIEVGNPVN